MSAPDYDAYQSSFHRAFHPELHSILGGLPLPDGGSVLDVPCGDGFYARRMAERVSGGRVVAVDASDDYMARACTNLADVVTSAEVEVRKADAYHLPYPDGTFDLTWRAQSLISLDLEAAVRELFRVTQPSGTAAVLEVDEFHHALLPWPTELEAVLPAAVHAASVAPLGSGTKLAPARRLRPLLRRVGFGSVRRATHPFERAAPFDGHTVAFLRHHLGFLRSLVAPHLPASLLTAFDRLSDPDARDSLLNSPDAELTCLNVIYLACP